MVVNDIDLATAEATAAEAARAREQQPRRRRGHRSQSADVGASDRDTVRERGRVDIVVNNAMRIVPGKLEELPEAAWDTTMNIGLKGAFLVSQAAARHMIPQRSGCFVNIASVAGLFPYNWAGPTAW